MIGMVATIGIASVVGIMSSFDYFKNLSGQRVAVQQQNDVNAAMASVLDYVIYLVKRRGCFNDNLTQVTCGDWCTYTAGRGMVCAAPFDSRITERLLFAPIVAQSLANYFTATNQRATPPPSNPIVKMSDVSLPEIYSTVDIANITEQHPLYAAIYPIRNFVKSLTVVVNQETLIPSKGREVTLRFMVDLNIDGTSGYLKQVLRGKMVTHTIGSNTPELHAEALITFYPRELTDFALITSGNLILAKSVEPISSTITDSTIPTTPKSVATGPGLVFQSPVFVNKSIYLEKAPDPAPSTGILPPSAVYANVTFGDMVAVGNGIVYQNKAGSAPTPFQPYAPGKTGSVYQAENNSTFGGFLKGVRMEGSDTGLECMFNEADVLHPTNPICTLNTSLSAANQACMDLRNVKTDLSLTASSKLVINKQNSSSSTNSATFNYILALTGKDIFQGAKSLALVRPTNSSTSALVSNCDPFNGYNPCWSSAILPTIPGVGAPSVISTDSTNFPLKKQTPVIRANFMLPPGTFVGSSTASSWIQADLGLRSKLSFALPAPTQANVQAIQATTTTLIADAQATLAQQQTLYGCVTAPLPSPSPSPSASPPPSCGTPKTGSELQADIDQTSSSISTLQTSSSSIANTLAAYSASDNPSAPKIQVTLQTSPIQFAQNQFNLSVSITNPSLLPSAPLIFFYAYDVGVNSYGLNMRTSHPPGGPNAPGIATTPPFNTLQYQSLSSSSLAEKPAAFSNGTWMNFDGTAVSAALTPIAAPAVDLALQCTELEASQDFGTSTFDLDFTSSAWMYWNIAPILPMGIVTPEAETKNILVIDSTNQNVFQKASIINKCIIDASATTVMGFMGCKQLYIDYSSSKDGTLPLPNITVGTPQTRTSPLQIIGTIVAGQVFVARSSLQAGISWRNIYHPDSVKALQENGVLLPVNTCKNATGGKPIWSKNLTDMEKQTLSQCSSSFLRDMASPVQLTSVTPNCGFPPSSTSKVVCASPLRAKNFKTINIFKQIGVE